MAIATSTNLWHFNPHSRVGSDAGLHDLRDNLVEFQSTLPRGE